MPKRKDILRTLINAINGLSVTICGEPRTIKAYDTIFDPSEENLFPCFYVVPAPEDVVVGLGGMQMDATMQVEIHGFVDTLGVERNEAGVVSKHFDGSEDTIEKIKQKLTSADFIEGVACAFSITRMGPIVNEHAGPEAPFGMIRIPLTVVYIDEGV